MKLQEAVRYINKKEFVSKVAYKLINDWMRFWKPGKKIGLDIEGTIMYQHENHPELVKGDPENWGRRQYKDVMTLVLREAYGFPFRNKEQGAEFKEYLKKIYKRL